MTYPNAPISEAVLDIKVSNLDNEVLDSFQELHSNLKGKYPNSRIINAITGSFTITGEQPNEISSVFQGVVFSNADSSRQVQFRIDGFTYNFLKPYTNWNDLKEEAKSLWEVYQSKFPNLKVERMALRYINRIVIPRPFKKLSDYILITPPIPKALPQLYNSFFSQLQIPCDKTGFTTIINSTIETPTEKQVPFILDIDVFKILGDEKFNFQDFDYIRDTKNGIFESCITEKARELFK
jgi:uncharacterized protein (TIGR04255 family)